MNRRQFVSATALAAAAAARAAAPKPFASTNLEEVTVGELQRRMRQEAFTSEQLTGLYLARIEDIDRTGPTLRSVIEINPDALAIARSLDAEYKAKGPRGPLHGMPVLLKDNIETGDKMQTTAGSLALVGQPAARDSWVAERLRAAGAIVLGKTNLSEWANFRSTHSTSGWSGRGGLTKNPYALDRNPCGSSSGTGAAISGKPWQRLASAPKQMGRSSALPPSAAWWA